MGSTGWKWFVRLVAWVERAGCDEVMQGRKVRRTLVRGVTQRNPEFILTILVRSA